LVDSVCFEEVQQAVFSQLIDSKRDDLIMNIENKMTFSVLLALLSAGALMAGCSQNGPRDYGQLASPASVIVGQGTGLYDEISIPAASMFEFDSAELNESTKSVIEIYRKELGAALTDSYLVLVVGHTDTSGDASYNDALSLKRAQSVADYLVSTGTKEDSIRVIGRGSREPIASNETLDGRIENRRVDILAVAEIRALDTILFPSAALFEPKSSALNEQGQALLEESRMDAKELLSDSYYIEIVGHTDNVGDEEDNMVLSKLRAASVRDYLISKRHDASKMVTTGKGETMPIADNDTDEGRAQNRRVEILVLGRIKE
jgi:outer membrane protein OmpA-like peptidoglycan-associated protein